MCSITSSRGFDLRLRQFLGTVPAVKGTVPGSKVVSFLAKTRTDPVRNRISPITIQPKLVIMNLLDPLKLLDRFRQLMTGMLRLLGDDHLVEQLVCDQVNMRIKI